MLYLVFLLKNFSLIITQIFKSPRDSQDVLEHFNDFSVGYLANIHPDLRDGLRKSANRVFMILVKV